MISQPRVILTEVYVLVRPSPLRRHRLSLGCCVELPCTRLREKGRAESVARESRCRSRRNISFSSFVTLYINVTSECHFSRAVSRRKSPFLSPSLAFFSRCNNELQCMSCEARAKAHFENEKREKSKLQCLCSAYLSSCARTRLEKRTYLSSCSLTLPLEHRGNNEPRASKRQR